MQGVAFQSWRDNFTFEVEAMMGVCSFEVIKLDLKLRLKIQAPATIRTSIAFDLCIWNQGSAKGTGMKYGYVIARVMARSCVAQTGFDRSCGSYWST